jgi:DNA (cytosine-5)-methyltransferase 1
LTFILPCVIMAKSVPAINSDMINKNIERTEFAQLLERSGLGRGEVATKLGYSKRTIYRWEAGETRPREAVLDRIRQLAREGIHSKRFSKFSFKFIDLFAGIGGLRRGFESIGGKCVFTSEWDASCRKTYQANFPCDHAVQGDITSIEGKAIPEHDVLLAGFPCQPFSIAGVSKKNSLKRPHGFKCETQGTLFFDVARIIEYHRPSAFLLENVKNLISHDKGNTFRVICDTLDKELGYHIDCRVINAKGFVPQNRQRIFIAGFRKDTGFDFSKLEIPEPEHGPHMKVVLHAQDGTEVEEPRFINDSTGKVDRKYTLSPKLWNYLKDYAEKHRLKGNGFGFGLVGPEDVARTLSARYYKDGSEILVKQRGNRPRRLTPRECARLMGFDKPGKPLFEIPVSDTQAYKQFGNAVVVPVVEAIAKFMAPHIQKIVDTKTRQVLQVKKA